MWVPRDRCVVELQSFLKQRYSSAQCCHGLLDPLNALEGMMSLQIERERLNIKEFLTASVETDLIPLLVFKCCAD